MIGLAGGTVADRMTQEFGPNIQIDGVEIDPKIVDVARTTSTSMSRTSM